MSLTHDNIRQVFDVCFKASHNTRMLGGAEEPLYLPAQQGKSARLFYREDFAASALHEAAHWCIAGQRRRQQTDFGYVYYPPPRSAAQQQHFFAAELQTQSLECLFAEAAGVEFQPSADNLSADTAEFAAAIEAYKAVQSAWLSDSAGARACQFQAALARRFACMKGSYG